jgi:peptidoglycan L-alanyl-D-glutamate endopeptidase CwlK
MYKLGERSRLRLKGVHPDLVKVVEHAINISAVDFTVLEGVRTPERQKLLRDSGASQTLNSRHITGHAVDLGALIDGEVRWDWPLYHKIAAAMKQAAKELNIAIIWGGDWRSFKDGPHFELDRRKYP